MHLCWLLGPDLFSFVRLTSCKVHGGSSWFMVHSFISLIVQRPFPASRRSWAPQKLSSAYNNNGDGTPLSSISYIEPQNLAPVPSMATPVALSPCGGGVLGKSGSSAAPTSWSSSASSTASSYGSTSSSGRGGKYGGYHGTDAPFVLTRQPPPRRSFSNHHLHQQPVPVGYDHIRYQQVRQYPPPPGSARQRTSSTQDLALEIPPPPQEVSSGYSGLASKAAYLRTKIWRRFSLAESSGSSGSQRWFSGAMPSANKTWAPPQHQPSPLAKSTSAFIASQQQPPPQKQAPPLAPVPKRSPPKRWQSLTSLTPSQAASRQHLALLLQQQQKLQLERQQLAATTAVSKQLEPDAFYSLGDYVPCGDQLGPIDSAVTSPNTDTDDDLLDTNDTSLIEHSTSEFDTIEWKKRVLSTSSASAGNSVERNKKPARKPPPPPPPGPPAPPPSNGYSSGVWKAAPTSRASRRNSFRTNGEESRDQASRNKPVSYVTNGGSVGHGYSKSEMASGSWVGRDQQNGSADLREVSTSSFIIFLNLAVLLSGRRNCG